MKLVLVVYIVFIAALVAVLALPTEDHQLPPPNLVRAMEELREQLTGHQKLIEILDRRVRALEMRDVTYINLREIQHITFFNRDGNIVFRTDTPPRLEYIEGK